MLTLRELKEQLDKLTELQLDTEIGLWDCGHEKQYTAHTITVANEEEKYNSAILLEFN